MSETGRTETNRTRRVFRRQGFFDRHMTPRYRASPDDRFVEVNRATVELFAFPDAETLLRTPIRDLYVDRTERSWWKARIDEAGVFGGFEVLMRRFDGREIWVRDSARLVVDERGLLYEGSLEDVTHTRLALQSLRDAQRKLTVLDAERRDLLVHLVHAREIERRRIAAEIHDDTIQAMTAVALDLERLAAAHDAGPEVDELGQSVRGAITRLRTLAFDLHPVSLEQEGLVATLRANLENMVARTGISYELKDELGDGPGTSMAFVIYRIINEALTNIRKHSQAKFVWISLHRSGPGISGEVRDDGVGFSDRSTDASGHLGIISSMQLAERAAGWLEVEGDPGRGTTVRFWIPEADHVGETQGM